MERFPSGQRGQTVNLLAMPSEVRILPSPPDEWNQDFFEKVRHSLIHILSGQKHFQGLYDAGVAQLVEHQPSKLRVAGSIPVSRSKAINLGW